MNTPTVQAYSELQMAYSFLNKVLFGNELPECLITFQRKIGSYGYLSHDRFINKDGLRTDEIAMNPAYFVTRTIEEILSTLVHEMVHLWQYRFGKVGRARYHNKQWAEKMKAVGLFPSSTGEPGGRETGDHMTHYIVENGVFDAACKQLLTQDYRITWVDRLPEMETEEIQRLGHKGLEALSDERGIELPAKKQKAKSGARVKFTCPGCSCNAWGKSTLNLNCGDCGEELVALDD